MNHTKKVIPEISVSELMNLLQSEPDKALDLVIDSRVYLSKKQQSLDFWEAYVKLDLDAIISLNPEMGYVFHTIGKLHLFYGLYNLYFSQISECKKQIRSLKPTQGTLLKTLFLAVELGDIYQGAIELPRYSFKSLAAIKEIVNDATIIGNRKNVKPYSPALFNCAKELLLLKVDFATLFDFINEFECGNLDLDKNEGGRGYKLSIPQWQAKSDNPFLLYRLKTDLKVNFQRQESHNEISQQAHFKKHDQVFKTNEGLVSVFYNGGEIISQPEGTTSMKVDASYFDNLDSTDSELQQQPIVKTIELMLEANFHYQLRHALSGIYYPNDKISLQNQKISLSEASSTTLYELFSAVSCLTAFADNLRYLSDFPGSRSLRQTKDLIAYNIKMSNVSLSDTEANEDALRCIVTNWIEIEKEKPPFYILTKEVLFSYFRKVDELHSKTDSELEIIIETISSLGNSIAFNPLYKIDDSYFFPYKTCGLFNLNRVIYDSFVSGKLFNTQDKSNSAANTNHKAREKVFTESIADALSVIATKTKSNLDYARAKSYELDGLKGDIDAIAYFEKENLLFAIQVKLSNTSKRDERGRGMWIKKNLYDEAQKQVEKDSLLLAMPEGLRFVSNQLDLKSEISNPFVFHLIVTDNLYADHQEIPFCEEGSVLCISYFELYNLINDIRIDSKQDYWESVIEKQSGEYLISLVLQNIFWRFLKEEAEKFQIEDGLRLTSREDGITLEV